MIVTYQTCECSLKSNLILIKFWTFNLKFTSDILVPNFKFLEKSRFMSRTCTGKNDKTIREFGSKTKRLPP